MTHLPVLRSNKAERQRGYAEPQEALQRFLARMERMPSGIVPSGNISSHGASENTSHGARENKWATSALQLSWCVMVGPASEITMRAGHFLAGNGAERTDLRGAPQSGVAGRAKRALDILIASIALVLLSPLMIATVIAIRITMGSPVFYAHPRIGMNGKGFRCLKFRTMVNNASEVLERHLAEDPESALEWRRTRKLARDPRIVGIGRLLRRSSIDELPQLVNVLRGEMSCVGPRPVVADEVERYGENAPEFLSIRPGLTGLWQVSGRSSLGYADRVNLDTLYVRRWSILLDLAILLKTIPAVMKFDGSA